MSLSLIWFFHFFLIPGLIVLPIHFFILQNYFSKKVSTGISCSLFVVFATLYAWQYFQHFDLLHFVPGNVATGQFESQPFKDKSGFLIRFNGDKKVGENSFERETLFGVIFTSPPKEGLHQNIDSTSRTHHSFISLITIWNTQLNNQGRIVSNFCVGSVNLEYSPLFRSLTVTGDPKSHFFHHSFSVSKNNLFLIELKENGDLEVRRIDKKVTDPKVSNSELLAIFKNAAPEVGNLET